MSEILCLSVRQPWASLIVLGLKDVENRTWTTKYRGPLLIHASLRPDFDARGPFTLTRDEIEALPRGGIIGEVELVDCVTSSSSPWFEGPAGLVLRRPRVLPLFPCRGRLGLFQVPPEQSAGRARRRHLPLPFGR